MADPDPGDIPRDREVAAPGLRETADIWFDTDRDPVVVWDAEVRRFLLADPIAPEHRLTLLVTERPVRDPHRVAKVLAEGLAACDFPPTEDRASQRNVERALRAAGLDPARL